MEILKRSKKLGKVGGFVLKFVFLSISAVQHVFGDCAVLRLQPLRKAGSILRPTKIDGEEDHKNVRIRGETCSCLV